MGLGFKNSRQSHNFIGTGRNIGFDHRHSPTVMLGRCLDVLGDLALPMALLIIGASLSFNMAQSRLMTILSASAMKLILLPGIGYRMHRICDLAAAYLTGIILLASPTATVSYVMAKEMKGDSELAVATISVSTLLSAVTFTLWLNVVGVKGAP